MLNEITQRHYLSNLSCAAFVVCCNVIASDSVRNGRKPWVLSSTSLSRDSNIRALVFKVCKYDRRILYPEIHLILEQTKITTSKVLLYHSNTEYNSEIFENFMRKVTIAILRAGDTDSNKI